jgi:hypothetical protein
MGQLLYPPDDIWTWSPVEWYWQEKELGVTPVPAPLCSTQNHMDWSWHKPGPPKWGACDYTPEPWHTLPKGAKYKRERR